MFNTSLKPFAAIVAMSTLAISNPARGEDALPFVSVDCGAGCAVVSPATHFLNAVAGATFLINIAHLAPAPEEALDGQTPIRCEPVNLRVDALTVGAADGAIAVKLGERLRLAAGEVTQIVERVDTGRTKGALANQLDLMGFRFRSQSAAPRCSIVASGLYYAPNSVTPIPFALLPGSSMKGD